MTWRSRRARSRSARPLWCALCIQRVGGPKLPVVRSAVCSYLRSYARPPVCSCRGEEEGVSAKTAQCLLCLSAGAIQARASQLVRASACVCAVLFCRCVCSICACMARAILFSRASCADSRVNVVAPSAVVPAQMGDPVPATMWESPRRCGSPAQMWLRRR